MPTKTALFEPLPASALAVQLYTVRESTRTAAGFAESLEKIAAIGYPAVQLSAVNAMEGETPAVTAALARRMLDDNGIKCAATHRSWTRLTENTDEEIAFHHELGCDFVAIGGIPSNYHRDGADGYRRFLTESVPLIAKLKNAGIRFGYHNHAHEFARVPGSRHSFWDIFAAEGGADFYLELDVYWAWHGGVDPVIPLRSGAGRVPVIHLKDKEAIGNGDVEMAPIGEGNLPWERILPVCREVGVEWYAVEQDECRRDPFDCLASSFRFLTGA